ncbi:MAG: hypothetical protein J0H94_21200, partial [Rhizobiales bacterium]|nr:hypothetical protein [Hyphomicrobiales bacterium]
SASRSIPGKSDTSVPLPRGRPAPVEMTATAETGQPQGAIANAILSMVPQEGPGSPNFASDLHKDVMSSFSAPWEGMAPADRAIVEESAAKQKAADDAAAQQELLKGSRWDETAPGTPQVHFDNADAFDPLGILRVTNPAAAMAATRQPPPAGSVHFDNADPYDGDLLQMLDSALQGGAPKPMGQVQVPSDTQAAAQPQGVQVADASGAVPQSATKIVEVDGRRMEVPADATPGEIEDILNAEAPTPGLAVEGNPMAAQPPTPKDDYVVPDMSWDQRVARKTQLGAQNIGSGLADFAGGAVDLPATIFNGVTGGLDSLYNWATGSDYHTPPPASLLPQSVRDAVPAVLGPGTAADWIKDRASEVATAAGVPPIPPDQQTHGEQHAGRLIEGGAGAYFGGLALAGRVRPALEALEQGKPVSGMIRPYMKRPVGALSRDVGAGMGATEAADRAHGALQDHGVQSPVLDMIAALVGGLMGGSGVHGLQSLMRSPRTIFEHIKGDPRVVDPATGAPYTRSQVQTAAKITQGAASEPVAAKATLDENVQDLLDVGVPKKNLPTSAMLTEDTGLNAMEGGLRRRNAPPFIDQDAKVQTQVAKDISSVRDPSADVSAVGPGIVANRDAIAASRDAQALPLLRQAEKSGAVVDANPVAAQIDQVLSTAKRPPVRNALNEARGVLNEAQPPVAPGVDKPPPVLDSTVRKS